MWSDGLWSVVRLTTTPEPRGYGIGTPCYLVVAQSGQRSYRKAKYENLHFYNVNVALCIGVHAYVRMCVRAGMHAYVRACVRVSVVY